MAHDIVGRYEIEHGFERPESDGFDIAGAMKRERILKMTTSIKMMLSLLIEHEGGGRL